MQCDAIQRPCVVYNPKSKLFVMWYEDRGAAESGYAVATSATPEGPFTPSKANITMPGRGRTGDYNIFVDDDGTGYVCARSVASLGSDSSLSRGLSLFLFLTHSVCVCVCPCPCPCLVVSLSLCFSLSLSLFLNPPPRPFLSFVVEF